MSTASNRVSQVSQQVGGVFYDWLKTEVQTSATEGNVNDYLNDFVTAKDGLAGGWNDTNNFLARKQESHSMRLPIWYADFREYPDEDIVVAKLSFAGLMMASGAFRGQCVMEATDGRDYMARRLNGTGIDVTGVVQDRFESTLPRSGNFAETNICAETFEREMTRILRVGELAVRKMSERACMGYDLATSNTPTTRNLQEAQYEWLTLATDAVALAAMARGGSLEAVPFLEPNSIGLQSSNSPHYPFRQDFPGWAEAMAA